jgi:hypothetical protein
MVAKSKTTIFKNQNNKQFEPNLEELEEFKSDDESSEGEEHIESEEDDG